jgi:hypothetical protein
MEHDIEKIIRAKVFEAERHPVIWEKDKTWAKLANAPSKNYTRTLWYLAAASVCAVGILLGYQHQLSLNENIQSKLSDLQQHYKEKLSEQNLLKRPDIIEEACANDPQEKTRHSRPATISRKQTVHEGSAEILDTLSDAAVPQIISSTQPDVAAVELQLFDKPKEVEPIVGIVDAEESSPSTTRKKNKLKLIKSSELVSKDKDDLRNTIMARIK